MPQATFLTINIPLESLDNVLALYDRIQVWRSTTGKLGVYSEITADTLMPATASSTVDPPWDVAGLTLTVSLSGADPVSILFEELVPPTDLRIEDVIAQVNDIIPGFATQNSDSNAVLDLTNPLSGTGSTLLLSGSARSVFGLPSTLQSGKGPRILIGLMNTQYKFTDLGGDPAYWYKTRYYSTKTKAVSAFSTPRLGDVTQILPPGEGPGFAIKAYVNLIDVTGKPVIGRRVILVPVQDQIVPYDNVNYGVLPGGTRIEITTDEEGYAEVYLANGARVRAFFEGSGYAREFVVPDQDFDLLSVLSTAPDPFSIVQSPPMPIRES
jgi:hypothetical protein